MLIKRDRENYINIKEFVSFFILIFKNKLNIISSLLLFLFFGLILVVPFDLGLSKKDLRRLNSLAINVERPLRKINYITGVLVKENILFSTSLFGILKRYLFSLNKDIDVINLDLKLDELEKIRNKRNQALEIGILTKGDDDEVNASISYENENYPVKLRLKGDYSDHLIGDKWSFRVKPKRGKAFKGLTEFSFQHPRTRSYLNEYIFHLFLKESELPHLRYEFFKLILNGKNLGTYALEEHFTKELIEYNRLRESPIFQFSCDLKYRQRARNLSLDGQQNPNPYIYNDFEIDVFNKKKVLGKLNQGSQFTLGKNLLSSFLLKEINSSAVFDLKNNTKYFSVVDLFGALHTLEMCNMRFYFDPILSRFSFIGFDADTGIRPSKRYLSIDRNPLSIFDDLDFSKEYVKNLEMLTSDQYLENMLNKLDRNIYSSLHKINKTFPHVRYLKSEILRSREYIKNRLSPINPIGINYTDQKLNPENITLVLYNRNVFPININHIFLDGNMFKPEKETILLGVKNKKVAYKKVKFQRYQSKNKFKNFNFKKDSLINVNYNLIGSKKIKDISVEPVAWFNSTDANNEYILKVPNHKDFKFIRVNDSKKVLKIDQGNWTIDKPLILPKEYKFFIEQGTTINITNGGYILSQGPVEFNGTKDAPILFNGIGDSGGLFVTNSKKTSFLNYVIFNGLKNLDEISLSITGSITFYNSPVSINNSNFYGTESEDSLNLFRSNFIIKNTSFNNIYADALDLDFSNGSLDNVSFENIGNDGLDLSGSIVAVENLSFKNIKDKSISIGEKSNINGNNIYIDKSFIGIASKDKSFAKVKNLNAKNLEYCLAAYNKKPEFGEGNIIIENIADSSICFSKYLLEKGSSISINSKKLLINSKDILQIIYEK